MSAPALSGTDPLVVPDASQDGRFAANPYVTGELGRTRFYAAQRLVTPGGVAVGTLSVFDDEPRELSDRQEQALRNLADRVVDALELGLRTRQLERSLTRLTVARDELGRSHQQLAEFAGQVSHDLRNPLTSVSMSLQMLSEQRSVMEDDDALWMVDRALSGAQRMDVLIEELLGYAAVGSGLTMVSVDLGKVLRQVLDDLGGKLEHVEVTSEHLPVVQGDESQLRSVLANLVDNAVKFSRDVESPRVRITGSTSDEGWTIEVADNGPGVPREDREAVFSLLTRRDKSVEGSGIGLAMCRRVIWAHGGTIEMGESAEGGALLRVHLPVDAASGPAGAAP
jgi:signal transduction histidine kinase